MEFIVSIFALFGFLFCAFIWLLPIILIASSDKTYGGEKAAWILTVIFVSWFAWVFYLLLAPIKRQQRYARGRRHDRYDYY